jgi:hypothetical protein
LLLYSCYQDNDAKTEVLIQREKRYISVHTSNFTYIVIYDECFFERTESKR